MLGSNFQHDVILIQAFIYVGDLALAESVAEGVVNVLNGDAETAGGVPVDDDGTSQTMHLLVGVDIAEFGDFLEALHDDGSPMCEIVEIVGLQGVLILCTTHAAAGAEVLNGLQIQSCAGNSVSLGADPRDDLVGAQLPLVERFKLSEHARGAATAASSGKSSDGVDGRILQNNVGQSAHLLRHGGKGEILIA